MLVAALLMITSVNQSMADGPRAIYDCSDDSQVPGNPSKIILAQEDQDLFAKFYTIEGAETPYQNLEKLGSGRYSGIYQYDWAGQGKSSKFVVSFKNGDVEKMPRFSGFPGGVSDLIDCSKL